MKRTIVAITGASGYLGKLLIPALQKDRKIERAIGIDIELPPDPPKSKKVEFIQADVRKNDIEKAITGADVLVHMEYSVQACCQIRRLKRFLIPTAPVIMIYFTGQMIMDVSQILFLKTPFMSEARQETFMKRLIVTVRWFIPLSLIISLHLL